MTATTDPSELSGQLQWLKDLKELLDNNNIPTALEKVENGIAVVENQVRRDKA